MSSTTKQFPTRQLGANGPTVSALGFGTMGIGAYYGQTDKTEAFKTLSRAADLGITFWDTADIYGNSELASSLNQHSRYSALRLTTLYMRVYLSWTPLSSRLYASFRRHFSATLLPFILDLFLCFMAWFSLLDITGASIIPPPSIWFRRDNGIEDDADVDP
ncbi:NADP-dependent oxidoreductase domain-containing protein [Mycena galopus ATCC 62051]|nr:NADP-dependent oxidoreductase domain-containing protein [Mycena galopus ATCC 62051]